MEPEKILSRLTVLAGLGIGAFFWTAASQVAGAIIILATLFFMAQMIW